MQNQGVLNASLAGIFAAFAGLCAKFALSEDDPHAFLRLGEILHFPSEYVRSPLFHVKNHPTSSSSISH